MNRVLLVVIILVAFAAVAMSWGLGDRCDRLQARIEKLEQRPAYCGKDVDGKEVWAPAVTVVELPR